ncbi:hypothetical protein MIZ01_0163 [Sideroxyarcus emersonii]|uniref:Uncharacterized protein n=1 Tax=Sideroxyarcus emersonii TaxID=2764705 RepID=A0AAN2BY61_9PROT|nr:hypothetical protein [Sideroxyarcus emersonii]BCK86407.1 hypothetical protein MIZ01_0163 [Sideroxyarcus emersonii]
MKKVVLTLAGVMAAAAFAPEASALPVFARQTGMACSACHFQHFPLLNSFGRAFKSAGFTMMGAQAKVEGDRLSIPAELNMAMLTSLGYVKDNSTPVAAPTTGHNAGNGAFYLPGVAGEASLFVGGRISDFAGFLSEITLAPGAAIDSAKTAILPEVADGIRAGLVPFATNGQGASYGFEYLNTGANAIHSITNTVGNPLGAAPGGNEFINAVSAQQYIGTATAADGIALVANSDHGFINLTKFNMTGIATGQGASLGSTYARLAAVFDVAGWDSAIGVQSWSGSSLNNTGAAADPITGVVTAGTSIMQSSKATAIDGQMQGDLGGMPTGFYFSYATAPVDTAVAGGNAFNAGTLTKSSFNVDAEIGVIPEVATVGAAIRRANSGVATAAGGNASDNAIYLTATYKIAQNMLARLSYVKQSGDVWTAAATGATGSQTTAINLYTLF